MHRKKSAFDILANWFSPTSVLTDSAFNLRMKARLDEKRLIKLIGKKEYDRLSAQVTQEDIEAALKNCNRKLPPDYPATDYMEKISLMDEIEMVLAALWEDMISKVIILVCNVVCFSILFLAIVFLLNV